MFQERIKHTWEFSRGHIHVIFWPCSSCVLNIGIITEFKSNGMIALTEKFSREHNIHAVI